MGIIIAVLLFSFIIIFHELGHFLLAKKNGIRVDEFSLGLGPTLLGKQIGETKFSLKLLPFGGACMMAKMMPTICRKEVSTVNPCGRECQLLRRDRSSISFLRVFSVLY